MIRLIEWLIGCRHAKTTFPLTTGRRPYVACLTCGKEFDYDWHQMRIGSPRVQPKPESKKLLTRNPIPGTISTTPTQRRIEPALTNTGDSK